MASASSKLTSSELKHSEDISKELNQNGYEDFIAPESKLDKHYQKYRDSHVYSLYNEQHFICKAIRLRYNLSFGDTLRAFRYRLRDHAESVWYGTVTEGSSALR